MSSTEQRDEDMKYIYSQAEKSCYRLDSLIFSFIKTCSSFEDVIYFILLDHSDPVSAFTELVSYIETFNPKTGEEEDILLKALEYTKDHRTRYIRHHSEEGEEDPEEENDRFNQHVEYDENLDF